MANYEKPGEMICNTANSEKCDYIVMGTRGLGKLRRTIMGSVSDYVVHHAHCPVIVARHWDNASLSIHVNYSKFHDIILNVILLSRNHSVFNASEYVIHSSSVTVRLCCWNSLFVWYSRVTTYTQIKFPFYMILTTSLDHSTKQLFSSNHTQEIFQFFD